MSVPSGGGDGLRTKPEQESQLSDSGRGSQSVVVITKDDLDAELGGDPVGLQTEEDVASGNNTDEDLDEFVYSDDFENSDGEDTDVEDNEVADFKQSTVPGLRQRNPNPTLPATVTKLETSWGSKVYIVGTAHFSEESQDDVSKTIEAVQPDVVLVELCNSRMNILQFDEERLLKEARDISLEKVRLAVQQSGLSQGIMHLLFLSVSAHLTKELGMAPGGEFRRAYNEAKKIPGCRLQLGDRPIQITISRALSALSIWKKLHLAWHLLSNKEPISKEDVEKCKQKDLLQEMLKEMTGEFPGLSRVFIDERDTFLAHSLKHAARPLPHPIIPDATIPSVVVGVVGIGHVPGIVTNWDHPQLDIRDVMRIPPEGIISKLLRGGVKLSILGALGYSCYRAYHWIMLRR